MAAANNDHIYLGFHPNSLGMANKALDWEFTALFGPRKAQIAKLLGVFGLLSNRNPTLQGARFWWGNLVKLVGAGVLPQFPIDTTDI